MEKRPTSELVTAHDPEKPETADKKRSNSPEQQKDK
jgi:hypothetical protein